MKHDVFISFKNSDKNGLPTPDSRHARAVYEALVSAGLKAFFSEESLAEEGHGDFSTSIETALESARILILVASCREHIESRWVKTEWGAFMDDLRRGKKQGEMFILNCGNLRPPDLPLFLRSWQMFSADSLEKLIKFVSHAVASSNSLRNFIRGSLHCFRPQKDEDKVYLLTVHPSGNGDSYHVTAYWGARTSKRLKSQFKAINVSAELAQLEVEKALREKLQSGYVHAPFAKILTPEARLNMSAAVGLHAAATTPKGKVKSGGSGAVDGRKQIVKAKKVMPRTAKKAIAKPPVAKARPKGGSKKTMAAGKQSLAARMG